MDFNVNPASSDSSKRFYELLGFLIYYYSLQICELI